MKLQDRKAYDCIFSIILIRIIQVSYTGSYPLTEPVTSKSDRYYIEDQFVAFWFRFIYPNLSNLEEGIYSASNRRKDSPQYMGIVFEKICKQVLIELIRRGRLSYDKVGKWWHKDVGIDVIALNAEKKEIRFAE